MGKLTIEEIHLILELIKKEYGPGYSDDKMVAALQAKLSILLQVQGCAG